MIRPGPRNLITDVPGILVGNAEDHAVRSGVTVVLPEAAAVCAVDVRGGAPGTRETDALDPAGLIEEVHAVVLSGGSAFGLDAAGGAMAWLAARGQGFRAADARIPIVPAAILFDLANGGDKQWGELPPYRELGRRACAAAARDFALGNAGAGLGAAAGHLKGGLGSASFVLERGDGEPLTVGALAAVNALGAVTMPGSAVFWAWPFEQTAEFGARSPGEVPKPMPLEVELKSGLGSNTTLVVVASDAALSKAQARRLAVMAQDGLARAIRPAHTPLDGDTVFAIATGRRPLARPTLDLARLGALAADCVSRAVARGVYEAADLGAMRSYRSVHSARGDAGSN
ncbi:MAG TPA: P1 family peptidase [Geminicoccaceae bacterium]|nr:P1 family peptidase [Geminicoccaceae bacterium]